MSEPLLSSTGPDAVIWGITARGGRFRPSDWAERLAGLTSAFGHDQKLAYSPLVMPVSLGTHKAVIVGRRLEALEPRFWTFLLQFAADNDLAVSYAHDAARSLATLVPPGVPTPEPREPV
jgi:hypothetical protein